MQAESLRSLPLYKFGILVGVHLLIMIRDCVSCVCVRGGGCLLRSVWVCVWGGGGVGVCVCVWGWAGGAGDGARGGAGGGAL